MRSAFILNTVAALAACFLIPAAAQQSFTVATIAGAAPSLAPVGALNAPLGQTRRLALDSAGNLYFSGGNAVYKLDSSGNVRMIAGGYQAGYSGDGGPATAARLNAPQGVAIDTALGNIYIADTGNNVVRMIGPDGTISTFAGNGTFGYTGNGSPANQAELYGPTGLFFSAGILYIADTQNNAIRQVTADGNIATICGNGFPGAGGDGGTGSAANLSGPQDVAVDGSGNIFIADTGNGKIREITASTGNISTLAGGGTTSPGDGGVATDSVLTTPNGVAVDGSGNVFISESGPGEIRQIDTKGIINVIAGTGTPGFSGDGSTATKAQLWNPLGMALDSSGAIYVADESNQRIRKISSGNIATVAGNGLGNFAGDGGPALMAQINTPLGIAVDSTGDIYFSDSANHRARKIAPDGTISTVAGNNAGDLMQPAGVAVDASANLYIADAQANVIRKVAADGTLSTIAGKAGTGGYGGDGGPASNALLYSPYGLAVDSAGNLFVSDYTNSRIRRIGLDGSITVVAGSGIQSFFGDGGPALKAAFDGPEGLTVDAAGNIYVADTGNNVVREITTDGNINTIAGTGVPGHDGDGGPANQALLAAPTGVAIDGAGNLYIADSGNRVRIVTPDGNINTGAGTGIPGYSGDGGTALNAQFNGVSGIAVDKAGNIYLTDTVNNVIRMLKAPGASGQSASQPAPTSAATSRRPRVPAHKP